jgi:hypothetical protein
MRMVPKIRDAGRDHMQVASRPRSDINSAIQVPAFFLLPLSKPDPLTRPPFSSMTSRWWLLGSRAVSVPGWPE